ncbi:MAG: 2Fe-2S iron-sulfur cluster-binding protein [Pseudolabrys sp.]
MAKIVYVGADGREVEVEVDAGANVMRTALANNVPGIVAECGGSAMCATCHVYVDPEFAAHLPDRGEVEDEMLESAAAARTEFSRLGCQIDLPEGMERLVVRIPETQR